MNQRNIYQGSSELMLIQKVVRLENESLPSRFDMVKVVFHYKPNTRMIYLNYALYNLSQQGYPIDGSQIFLWDHVKGMFLYAGMYPNQTEMMVEFQHFQESMIHIRYRKINKTVPMQADRHDASKRVKQRSIQEAIESVRRWMEMYELTDKNGKRLFTLQSAAKEIGIAKKTLDDYKFQIRMGEELRFDFNKNRAMKIGVLRNFTKEKKRWQDRPSSPQALPLRQSEAEAHSYTMMEQEGSEYLFHSRHSCYGGSDNGSNRD